MPPEATATVVSYGIVKMKEAMEKMRAAAASVREEMLGAIDTLQENPYPNGHEVMAAGPARIITCVVEMPSKNRYLLNYTVDEQKEKVYIIYVDEKRFD
jgi:hypothetical protein